ncbi:MAG: DUF4058 family protein, partial [Kamptonema sp. SIO4C4]|nr:DUF4058 family protein [Kamptonema sp. SIO4C4]
MPSPFPGMNPYLEHPELWPGVHLLLIAELTNFLTPQLRPKYRVAVEVRTYNSSGVLVGLPDLTIKGSNSTAEPLSNVAVASPPSPISVTLPVPETIRQGYLEVREVATGEVVTVIELLSPINKRPGEGRRSYEQKRLQILGSLTHFIEIDLLRGFASMPILENDVSSHYRVLVSRSDQRPKGDLYAFNVQQAIPSFPLPLRSPDPEIMIDLQALIHSVYDRAGYDLVIDYSQSPVPPQKTEAQ